MIKNINKSLSIKFSNYLLNSSTKKQIDIYIIKDNELKKINLFFDYILKDKADGYLGIDFEFNNLFSEKENRNTRQVALIQINYNDEFILMFHPEHLSEEQKNRLKNIFFKPTISKILHGAESLDVKYLFDEFFSNKNEKKKFLHNFYDTKFICEYLNLRDKSFGKNKKCKIYQLLLKSGLIDKKILNKLEKNEERMGPIYNIIVDVNKMSNELINYTLFDVFYLIQLFKRLKISKDELKFINYFLHNILLNKNLIDTDNMLINKFNNSFIINSGERFTLSYILEYYDGLFNLDNDYNKINDIPYFKKLLTLIIKKSLLDILSNNIKIYFKKNEPINNQVKSLHLKYNFNTKSLYTNEIYNYLSKDLKKLI